MAIHKKTPRYVFSFFFLFFCAVSLPAAGELSISGTVLDPSRNSVPDATLTLYNATSLLSQTRSGPDGGFAFSNLVPGSYLLECRKDGFQKHSRRIFLDARPETFSLTLEIAGLNQHVLVIGSELPELPREISKAVSVVSAEELGARDIILLTEALRQTPSIQIQQLGGPGTLASYRFRGLRPQDTAILVDGFRFRDVSDIQGSARPFLSHLLVTDAERIEVLRGAGSTLYGTNAIGGTINVVPREPTRPLAGSVSFRGGSLGLLEGGGGLSGQSRNKRLGYSLRADHINYTTGLDGQDTYRNNSGVARATYSLSPQVRLLGRFLLSDSFLFLNENPSPLADLPPLPPGEFVREAIPFPKRGATFYSQFDDPDSHQRNRFYSGAVRLTHQVNRVWSYTLGYQGVRTRRRTEDGPAVSSLARELGYQEAQTIRRNNFNGTIHEISWRNNFSAGAANLTNIGFDFDRVTLDQTSFGLTTEAVQRSFAFSVQNQTRLLRRRVHLQLAFQARRYGLDVPRFSDSTGNPFASVTGLNVPTTYSGDVSLAYFIARSGTKLRVHAGNGYRSPSLFERFGSGGSGVFRSYFGNPQLRAERSVFIDGGFDQYAFGDKLQVSATYFYSHLQTIVEFGATPDDRFNRSFGYFNLTGGNARGVELSVSYRPSGTVDFRGNYTFTKSNQPSPTSAGTTRLLGHSDHQFSLGTNLRPARRLHLNLQASGISDYDFPVFGLVFTIPPETFRFQGYVRLDLTGSYVVYEGEKSKLRFVAKVDNLLNREYYQGGFLAPRAVLRTGIHFDF